MKKRHLFAFLIIISCILLYSTNSYALVEESPSTVPSSGQIIQLEEVVETTEETYAIVSPSIEKATAEPSQTPTSKGIYEEEVPTAIINIKSNRGSQIGIYLIIGIVFCIICVAFVQIRNKMGEKAERKRSNIQDIKDIKKEKARKRKDKKKNNKNPNNHRYK